MTSHLASTDSNSDNIIGRRLRQARIEAGFTQENAAELAGISFPAISRYENGQRSPMGAILIKLAAVYKKPVEWFTAEGGSDISASDSLMEEKYLAFRNLPDDLTPEELKSVQEFIEFVKSRRDEE